MSFESLLYLYLSKFTYFRDDLTLVSEDTQYSVQIYIASYPPVFRHQRKPAYGCTRPHTSWQRQPNLYTMLTLSKMLMIWRHIKNLRVCCSVVTGCRMINDGYWRVVPTKLAWSWRRLLLWLSRAGK